MRNTLIKAVVTSLVTLASIVPSLAVPPADAPNPDPRLSAGNNAFGFNLLRQLAAKNKGANVLISPYSISTALGMIYNGSAGTTRQEMAQTLGVQGLTLPAFDASESALRTSLLHPGPGVQLTIANALWARQGVSFNQDFLHTTHASFGAETHTLDFSAPNAVPTINAWVKANTKGKIPTLIGRLDPSAVMVLLNAIYFKGQWQNPFDPKVTKPGDFHLNSSDSKTVPLMTQSGHFNYWHGTNFAALALPYGQGRLSMIVLLPDAGVPVSNLLNNLDSAHWNEWLNQMSSREGTVKLPRFKMDFSATLNDPLQALGIKSAFTASADFSGMRPQHDVFISQVVHKALMEVNEEGTVATAVTGITVGATAAPVDPPFEFTANRPFITTIVDNQTGSVLFTGVVADPQ